MNNENFKKIFISHSSEDEEIIKYFVDDILIGVLGFFHTDIFCTSLDGMKIESGEDWRKQIEVHLNTAPLSILFITPNYKMSEICQNELGASWIVSDNVVPLIVEPITYSNVGILQEVRQVEKVTNEKGLDRLKDKIIKIFDIPNRRIKSDRWTSKKREFITKTNIYLKENPFKEPITEDNFKKIKDERDQLQNDYESVLKENINFKKVINELEEENGEKSGTDIKLKHGLLTEIEKFEELLDETNELLNNFHSAIITFIFNSYTNNDLYVNYDIYRGEIEEAIARQYINKECDVLWENSRLMRNLHNKLKELEEFINELDSTIIHKLEQRYDENIEIDINNLSFWEFLIGIKLYYN